MVTAAQRRARNAVYQARWRERRDAAMKARPEVVEGALMQRAERCNALSDQERRQLADKLADAAMGHLRRAQGLAALARPFGSGSRSAHLMALRTSASLTSSRPAISDACAAFAA